MSEFRRKLHCETKASIDLAMQNYEIFLTVTNYLGFFFGDLEFSLDSTVLRRLRIES